MTVAATPMARREVKNLAHIEIFGQFMSIPWIPTRTVWDLGSLEFDRSLGVVAL